jgi:hypothetical protein
MNGMTNEFIEVVTSITEDTIENLAILEAEKFQLDQNLESFQAK